MLRLREALDAPLLPAPSVSLDAAIEIALRTRPDLRLARLTEEVALAGYRLAKAEAAPQVSAIVTYTDVLGTFDVTPIGVLSDRDKLIGYGFSITLPILNRNQGRKKRPARRSLRRNAGASSRNRSYAPKSPPLTAATKPRRLQSKLTNAA